MSTGAKAGIGVAVVCFLLVCAAGADVFYQRRKISKLEECKYYS